MAERKEVYTLHLVMDIPAAQLTQNTKVGEFLNREGECVAHIILNDAFIKEFKMRQIAAIGPQIVFTTAFLEKCQHGDNAAVFCLFHELGHICHNDNEGKTSEQVRQERRDAIQAGGVAETERNADAFAAEHYGINESIAALKKGREERAQRDREHGVSGGQLSV